jgi:glycosyltransferase involved in cell wall biosynthesis
MQSSLVTIGMSVRNCEHTLGPAIASIVNQTFQNWELLVIDDGSSDTTMSVASSFNDPRIVTISDGNIIFGRKYYGFPGRLNQAVKQARPVSPLQAKRWSQGGNEYQCRATFS